MPAPIDSRISAAALSPSQISLVVVAVRVFGVFCQAVMIMLLANTLSLADMGIFSAIFVFWGLVRMLGPLGLDQIGMREIARARVNGEGARAAAIAGYTAKVSAVAGSVVGLGAIALLFVTAPSAHVSPLTLLLIAVVAPASSLTGLLSAAVRYYDRAIASQAVEAVGYHLLTLALLFAQFLLFGLSLETVLICHAVGVIFATVVYALMLRRARGPDIAKLETGTLTRIRRESFDAWQALLLIGLAVRAPTFLSISLLGPAATAILEIALRFGTLPTIITSGVATTFAPTMASQHAKEDRSGLGHTLAVSSWLAFVPAAFTLLGVAVFGPWLLATFFPPEYQLAYLPLLLVIASTTVHGGFGMSHTVLFMSGHQRVVRFYSVLQLVAVLVLGSVLALLLGVNGIALALLISSIIFDVGLARQVKPLLNVTGILRPDGLGNLVRTLRGQPLATSAEGSR